MKVERNRCRKGGRNINKESERKREREWGEIQKDLEKEREKY